ncbi:MAG: Modification methylase HaeIII [candidate division WS6 bacterium OLB20]|uniref:Cytosine-specific methyltransferase n=1 Tax=candidate division WS6 bacterium OLB20 TaxID=1617426 RepID=A0A136LZ11_9BACT|nr:MAG: Modification methylase HaeIII [candidate division WS6 bacterium OLB20]
MKIASLFAGAGGLDKGFENAGFTVEWANEYDKTIWETFRKNFPKTRLDERSIRDVDSQEIKSFGHFDGLVGGPPCQSWSLAGSMKGIEDQRGSLFYEYLRVLSDIEPKFFLAENVPGLISKRHIGEYKKIVAEFEKRGYQVTEGKVNASDYGVPEDRERVIIVGFHKDLNRKFIFPERTHNKLKKVTLKQAIGDLPEPVAALPGNNANSNLKIPNHEYFTGAFSSRFMSRNRIRGWDEQAYTIEASGRHAKLHPSAPPMKKINKDEWIFEKGSEHKYRRLSIRESARIQTFPDNFIFHYSKVNDGYKMVGNAVPVKLAEAFANEILKQIA